MSIKNILFSSFQVLLNCSKLKLIEAIQALREHYKELEKENIALKEEITKLKEKLTKKEIESVNKKANKPEMSAHYIPRCFFSSAFLQLMHCVALGTASSRAFEIWPSHVLQLPYVPFSMRSRASFKW